MYAPGPAPNSPDGRYARQEFEKIAQEIRAPKVWQLSVSYAEPDKPRDGMIVVADGVEWNPGSGAGVYGRYGGAWVKLG